MHKNKSGLFIQLAVCGVICLNLQAQTARALPSAPGKAKTLARPDLDIPALIIHGRQDPMPESVALENQKLLKGSRLVWLDKCGHWPWIEQPAALEKAMFEFLFR